MCVANLNKFNREIHLDTCEQAFILSTPVNRIGLQDITVQRSISTGHRLKVTSTVINLLKVVAQNSPMSINLKSEVVCCAS